MSEQQLFELLEASGLPVVYYAWPKDQAPAMPYLCYLVAYSANFAADGAVYQEITHYQIELYTPSKNPQVEAQVENALQGIFWEKTETWIDTEQCFQILYEIEV